MTTPCYNYKMETYRCASRKIVRCVCRWGTVIVGRALRRFPVWVTVAHQLCVHFSKQSWHIRVTVYLETHTREPLKALAHRRPSLYRSHTRTGDPTGRTHTGGCLNIHRHKWPLLYGSVPLLRKTDGDRWVWFRERPRMEEEDNVKTEEMSFRGGPTGWQDMPVDSTPASSQK